MVVQVSVMSSPHALVAALRVDVTVPLIRHSPDAPLVYVKSLGTAAPQATVIAGCAAYTGAAAGLTVIVLDTDATVLSQASVAVHVSVTGPPHAPGVAVNVEVLDTPLIKQSPVNPFVNVIVLVAGTAPHATVMFAGAVIVGRAAGLT